MEHQEAVKKALVTGLTILERVLSNPHRINFEDAETRKIYLASIRDEEVDPEILGEAFRMIAKAERFIPAPAIVVEYARKAAEEVRFRRSRAYLDSCVICLDENGAICAAPAERVRDGRLLPEGDRTGDGSAAKALPAGEISEGGRQMLAYLRSSDRRGNVQVEDGPKKLGA